MYLDDPREQQIDINNHAVWEEDNRVEARYQWGAAIWDLCNMDPKDYGETIFITRPAGEELIKNNIIATFEGSAMTLDFAYSPDTNIYIVAKDSEGHNETFVLNAGSTSPTIMYPAFVVGSKISSLCIGPSAEEAKTPTFSDDKYKYRIIKKINIEAYAKFALIRHRIIEISGITEESVSAYLNTATVANLETDITYNIICDNIPGYMSASTEEAERIVREKEWSLLFFSTTSSNNFYMSSMHLDDTSNWIRNFMTISLDGMNYEVSQYVDTIVNIADETAGQVPIDRPIDYEITLNKN